MRITRLKQRNFRNLVATEVGTDAKHVTLIGNNGQGKTNFLEAVYMLCYGVSFRGTPMRHIVRSQSKERELYLEADIAEGTFDHRVTCLFKDNRRIITVDGREIQDRKELIFLFPCIVFSHEDILFVTGTPEEKRRFYDQTLSLYEPLFIDDIRRYRHILKQRNALLKQEGSHVVDMLFLYDAQLAETGLEIQRRREQLVEEFNLVFPGLHRAVAGTDEDITVVYRPSWRGCETVDDVRTVLDQSRERDMTYSQTHTGPHRDQFFIMKGKHEYTTTASTGQRRLVSLVLRTAQADFFRKKTGKEPVILLDDVLLELDIERRGRFLENITGYSQAFLTFLPEERYFREGAFSGIIYEVADGVLTLS